MTGQGEVARGDAVGHQALLDGRGRLDRLTYLFRCTHGTLHVGEHIASKIMDICSLVGQDVAPVVVAEERRVESGSLVFEERRIDAQLPQLRGPHLVPAGRLLPVSAGVGPACEVHLVPDEALLARARVDGVRRLSVVAVVDVRRPMLAFGSVKSGVVSDHKCFFA